jgi:hypothetical protein
LRARGHVTFLSLNRKGTVKPVRWFDNLGTFAVRRYGKRGIARASGSMNPGRERVERRLEAVLMADGCR